MVQSLAHQWQATFWQTVQQSEHANVLREAGLQGRLTQWTTALTAVVVATCQAMDWQASAKGHPLGLFPASPSEFLALDVMAFESGRDRWQFPIAAMELENSPNPDRSAYSLWKVLCVRASLRVVFCYRRKPEERASLITFLRQEVLQGINPADRMKLDGQTLIVVGSRNDSATFPYGFFKWWQLEPNTSTFTLM